MKEITGRQDIQKDAELILVAGKLASGTDLTDTMIKDSHRGRFAYDGSRDFALMGLQDAGVLCIHPGTGGTGSEKSFDPEATIIALIKKAKAMALDAVVIDSEFIKALDKVTVDGKSAREAFADAGVQVVLRGVPAKASDADYWAGTDDLSKVGQRDGKPVAVRVVPAEQSGILVALNGLISRKSKLGTLKATGMDIIEPSDAPFQTSYHDLQGALQLTHRLESGLKNALTDKLPGIAITNENVLTTPHSLGKMVRLQGVFERKEGSAPLTAKDVRKELEALLGDHDRRSGRGRRWARSYSIPVALRVPNLLLRDINPFRATKIPSCSAGTTRTATGFPSRCPTLERSSVPAQ